MPASRCRPAARDSSSANDGLLYITVGGAGRLPDAQATNTIFGKVLRLKDDGTVPADNPFVGKAGSRPEIFTIGHRDHHGIAVHPATGQIFHAELGPIGGDKINILKPGGNYGWPTYGYGRDNDGSPMPLPTRGHRAGMDHVEPRHHAVGPAVLHRRQVPEVEGQHLRRQHRPRPHSRHRRHRARRLQRQAVGAAPRDDPRRTCTSACATCGRGRMA